MDNIPSSDEGCSESNAFYSFLRKLPCRILRDVVANVLDCDIVVSEFELQLRYDAHF